MKGKFNHDEYLKEYRKRVFSRLTVDMKKEKREEIQRHADLCGETLTGYIKKAVEMRMAAESGSISQSNTEPQKAEPQKSDRTGGGQKAGSETKGKKRIIRDGEHGLRVVYAGEEGDDQ